MAVETLTFGCRLNAYESEVMRAEAEKAGLSSALIINTCAVTAEAVRQSRQAIRKLRRERPGTRIIVTGCAAQTEPETYAAMPEVNAVLGNQEKLTAAAYADFGMGATERVRVNDIMSVTETAPQMVDHFEGRARAFVSAGRRRRGSLLPSTALAARPALPTRVLETSSYLVGDNVSVIAQ